MDLALLKYSRGYWCWLLQYSFHSKALGSVAEEKTLSKTVKGHGFHNGVAIYLIVDLELCQMLWRNQGVHVHCTTSIWVLSSSPFASLGWCESVGIRRIVVCGIHAACQIESCVGQRTTWWSCVYRVPRLCSKLMLETLGDSWIVCSFLPSWRLVWLAVFQSVGVLPCCSEDWKSSVSAGVISSAIPLISYIVKKFDLKFSICRLSLSLSL